MKFDELHSIITDKHPNFEANNNLICQLGLEEVSPDTLVDYAHSINEGIAKNFRFLVDKSLEAHKIEGQVTTIKHWNSVRGDLCNDLITSEFLECLHQFFETIRTLRNRQGDTTHGHLGPKEYCEKHVARFLLDLSISHARYVLGCADYLDPSKIPYRIDGDRDEEERRKEFHRMLDLKGNRLGGFNYSKLIYDNDYDLYTDELDRFDAGVPSSLKDM